MIQVRLELKTDNPLVFVNYDRSKMEFRTMNEIVLDRLESVKEEDIADELGPVDVEM